MPSGTDGIGDAYVTQFQQGDQNTLTFTADDWNMAQTVTVSAAQDADAVVDDAVTVEHIR